MVIFLHRNIIVSNCLGRPRIYVKGVGEAIMFEVVADPCNQEGEYVDIIELEYLKEAPIGKYRMLNLWNVRSMKVIMVLDLSAIAIVDLS